jgi:UrcA family protein
MIALANQHLLSQPTSVETNMSAKVISQRALRACGAVLALALIAGAAQAATPSYETATVKVSYGDLNLASAEGSKALYSRIVSAARAVCYAYDVDGRDLHAVAIERSCEERAISRAVQDVHSTQLAALSNVRLTPG